MTTFESILLLAVTACVIITAFGVLVIKKMLQEIIDRKDANWEQLRKIETHTNFLADISQQLDNIENSNDQDFEKLTDTVNKMHRNLCAIIAEKMVERTFPIKKGQPLDAAFEPEVAELKRSDDVYAECRTDLSLPELGRKIERTHTDVMYHVTKGCDCEKDRKLNPYCHDAIEWVALSLYNE